MEPSILNQNNIAQDMHYQGLNWNRFNSAMIMEIKRDKKIFTSSAVAIGRNMLLTAAHSIDCFTEGRVLLGDSYRSAEAAIKIKKCIVHPSYNPSKSFFENDLAIVILEHNLPHGVFIEKLHEDINLSNGEPLERIGFGGRENKNLKTWTNPCYKTVTFNQKNYVLEDFKSVIGDSGGPIYKNENGMLKLIGIHSTLEGSNKTYIVNISKYIDWIEANRSLRGLG